MARKFLATLLTVVALVFAYSATTPTAQDAEGDACAESEDDDGAYSRRKICEGWGTTLKNNVRVAFAKTGERPITLTGSTSNGGSGMSEGATTTRHGAVHDHVFGVEGDDDGAAIIVEEIEGGAYGLMMFGLADSSDEWHWYESLDELKESHDSIDIDVSEFVPAPGIELMKLYTTPGRKWTHEVIEWRRGGTPNVETVETEVDEVSDGFATWSSKGESETGNSESKAGGEFRVESPSLRHRNWAGEDLPVETVATDGGEFECRRHRVTVGGIQTTTWVSTEYHPLVVKQVKLGKDYTEIHKLKSFYAAEVDPWLLFRKVGRKFTLKATGDDMEESYIHVTVTRCDADGATVEVLETDVNDKPIESGPDGEPLDDQPRVDEIKFNDEQGVALYGGGAEVIGGEVETVEVEAGEFGCFVIQNEYGRRSYSRNWIWLPVMLEFPEQGNMDFELTSFDLGHDMREFYDTVGNYYVMETRSEFEGFETSNTMRMEVIEVLDDEAKVKTTNYDQNGNEFASNTMNYPVPGLKAPADDEPAEDADDAEEEEDNGEEGGEEGEQEEPEAVTPYDGQFEEWITTPAGSFAAIRSKNEVSGMETVSWTWNGLAVRSETKGEGMRMVMEITELHME